ncbi:MAG: cation transporter [Pseudomonadota bacterium]
MDRKVLQTAKIVIALNLGYFIIQISVAALIGSVSLFADSIDFLEDASINALILVGHKWSADARRKLGIGLAIIILMPGIAALLAAWQRYSNGTPPPAMPLSVTAFGALLVNGTCALLLAKHSAKGGSLTKAAFLSARNDTLANVAIIFAGVLTALLHSLWPDLIVGLGIGLLNAGAAWEVWEAAEGETDDLAARPS